MADKTSILSELRIIPKETDYLDKRLGSNGEIFFDKGSQSLRIYDGITIGGYALLRADLENIEGQISSVIPSADPPTDVDTGTVWFNTNNGKIYILYNDGTSTQWVQPTSIAFGGGGGGGGGASSFSDLSGFLGVNQISDNSITPEKLNLNSSLIPVSNESFDLGSSNYRWRDLYLSGDSINLGSATITASGNAVVLPAGSTIAGTAINSFSIVSVAGQNNIVADSASDTLTLVAGPGITLTTNATNDSITITNSGGGGGGGSGVSSGQENRLAYYASTGSIIQDTGTNLTWDGSQLNITGTIIASGEQSFTRNYFDTLSELSAVSASTWHGMIAHVHETGRMYFAHSGQWQPLANLSEVNQFTTIAVAGQTSVVADTTSDTLTLVAGSGISITTNATNDSITITNTGGGGGGTSTLNDLTDVVITTPSTGQVLKYNGTSWINGTDSTSGGTASLDSLDDVVLTAPSIGQILKYNGTSWVNDSDDTGSGSSNSFQTIAVAGQSSVVAESSGDTLNIAAGTGISITTNPTTDTLTITSSVVGGATQFTGLGDISSASLTVDKIYLQAITRLVVDNNGVTAYTFDQYTGNNPTIFALSGTTIAFDLSAIQGHPFVIQDGSATNYDTGLIHVTTSGVVSTGSSAQGKDSGTLYWKIPSSISGNYRYQCGVHAAMVGNITVKGFASI